VAGTAATVAGVALLNRAAPLFEVSDGVALVFPASAVTVLAGVTLGWWGAAAAFVGYLLTPWGLSTTPPRAAFFAFAATLQAIVPALLPLRPAGSTDRRILRLLLVAVVANTLLSAAVGTAGLAAWSDAAPDFGVVAISFTSWFLGDLTAILLLAVPALLLIAPELALAGDHRGFVRRWSRDLTTHVVTAGVVVLVVGGIETLAADGAVHLHWLAIPLLAPVLVAASRNAVAGGLLTTGVVGVVYVVEVVRHAAVADPGTLYREMTSSYLNVLAFGVAAVVAGLASGRSASLMAELSASRAQIEKSFDSVVVALAAAIEAKDPTTEGHVQRVARLAEEVGRELGLPDHRLRLLRYAAVLHDVGKIGVPEAVLGKRGPLDDDERAALERHVEIGVDIIRNVEVLGPAVPFIRYHQERWDGCRDPARVRHPGYFGLAGEEIPLEARIIPTVDAWDAMTSDRPYRDALETGPALTELRREAGAQFDPAVVEALVRVLGRRGTRLSRE